MSLEKKIITLSTAYPVNTSSTEYVERYEQDVQSWDAHSTVFMIYDSNVRCEKGDGASLLSPPHLSITPDSYVYWFICSFVLFIYLFT